MKTKILLLSLMTSVFALQMQAQNRTRVNAMNDEISDNLDLRAVTDIFGDSRNLQDFERRLNDPELQISNLDLNYDNEVDYLRVIETVDYNTHVIIIQSVLDRDVYQDVATIEVEKDRYNRVHIQVVGNEYMYGPNYIYEPNYYSTPVIYASLWSNNYRPYVSNWYWNFYPSYYYAWNPFPVYRYRNNIQLSLNIHNNYNYVTSRRSNQAVVLYSSRRSNGYEKRHPDYAFSRRNATVSNRYELDQRRNSRSVNSRNDNGNSRNRTSPSREQSGRVGNQRDYSQNRAGSSRQSAPQRTETQSDNSQNRTSPSRETAPQRTQTQRDNSQNRTSPSRETAPQRTQTQRDNSQSRTSSSRETVPQRMQTQRENSQNRGNSATQAAPQRTQTQRDNSQNRASSARQDAPQRAESQRRNSSSNEEGNNSSRGGNRRT
ncbi:hypothetical protein [Flavobacterium frigoris]|uniref:DUF3300 domain-containing protein n=1 Tax=Flavobacterium frigoris (strain PS1) TaxID=1086011 RepID=H7FTZ9_FLAFP|nr:hypothetical protein [Flavobacterium frigoris]EIA07851.1 hypothetical protein HJ01_02719 [Flavobacterium frigoris PS1]